jgi:hypothetical protein
MHKRLIWTKRATTRILKFAAKSLFLLETGWVFRRKVWSSALHAATTHVAHHGQLGIVFHAFGNGAERELLGHGHAAFQDRTGRRILAATVYKTPVELHFSERDASELFEPCLFGCHTHPLDVLGRDFFA